MNINDLFGAHLFATTQVAPHPDAGLEPCCSLDQLLDPLDLKGLIEGKQKIGGLAEQVSAAEQVRMGSISPSAASANSDYPLGPTLLGRYYSIIRFLEPLLPQRSRNIMEMGMGVSPYRHFLGATSWTEPLLESLKNDKGVSQLMATSEPFEMAALAGEGGSVHVFEWDGRLIEISKANVREGILTSSLAPFTLSHNYAKDLEWDPIKQLIMKGWMRYVRDFENAVGKHLETFQGPGVGDVAAFLTFKDGIAERIITHHEDIATAKIDGEFDLAWGTMAYPYAAHKLWLASLVKAVHALSVGGLLVTDNFDEDSMRHYHGSFGAFLHHAGLEVAISQKPPWQPRAASIVVARKTQVTPWLEDKMALLRDIGIA